MKLFRKYDTETAEETAGEIHVSEASGFWPYLRLLKIAVSQLSRRTAGRRVCHLSAGYVGTTSIHSATPTAIAWDRRGVFNAESFAHDTAGKATKIFVRESGVHTVYAQISAVGTSGGGPLYGEIWRNGLVLPMGLFVLISEKSGEVWAGSIAIPVYCQAGDYLEVKGVDYDGITTDAAIADGGSTHITIIREL